MNKLGERRNRKDPREIESQALEVLRTANALSAPVDMERVSASVGAKVKYAPLEAQVSGLLLIKGDEKHVMINSAHPTTRQRFTWAHEIGHLRLHDAIDRLFIDEHLRVYQRAGTASASLYEQSGSLTKPHEEQEANLFASALLMPRALLERAALERDLTDEWEVAALASAFCVSEQAMSIRLQQLGFVRPVSQQDDV
jgi:Zn-dependent peptidase ImmA (M78 family)